MSPSWKQAEDPGKHCARVKSPWWHVTSAVGLNPDRHSSSQVSPARSPAQDRRSRELGTNGDCSQRSSSHRGRFQFPFVHTRSPVGSNPGAHSKSAHLPGPRWAQCATVRLALRITGISPQVTGTHEAAVHRPRSHTRAPSGRKPSRHCRVQADPEGRPAQMLRSAAPSTCGAGHPISRHSTGSKTPSRQTRGPEGTYPAWHRNSHC
mmetsp:Transcript_79589/g.212760  ORF Transcript_79589/g.212760 Transcript_79589/m.212760 type:complete len:207 (-) Transcript_79589:1934-2554(-)